MKRVIICALGLAACQGCASPGSAEASFQKTADAINEMADVLERSPSVREARPKAEKLIARLEQVRDEALRVRVTDKEMKVIQSRFVEKFTSAARRLSSSAAVLRDRDPAHAGELDGIVQRFRDILEKK